ncbi:hypothetical protein M408DRAFT_121968 [Serendipita vermifera MAFF 305830]|uniref:Uncharacterized protein n=1 Tax=Serendipita vermifera MAFF 305830 TaxID=933852 RepID=A0A0C3AXN8_SERVB|nr:hypothetical protein M408DRAFT_121968 [Serendipita vermifera MAFF 305830]
MGSFLRDEAESVVTITFPRLNYLALKENWDNDPEFPFPLLHAATPKLTSYEQMSSGDPGLPFDLHGDLKHVLHFRTETTVELANHSNLRSLQLQVNSISEVNELVELLRDNPSVCPLIEAIEISPSHMLGFFGSIEWEELMIKTKQEAQTPRPQIKFSIVTSSNAIPGPFEWVCCKHGLPRR